MSSFTLDQLLQLAKDGRVDQTICVVGITLLLATLLTTAFAGALSKAPKTLPNTRWTSTDPAKAWTEKFYLYYAAYWIAIMAVIIVTKSYEWFEEWEYMYSMSLISVPGCLVPLLLGAEKEKPFSQRYWFRANVWIFVLGYVGNYFWTHYFYTLLDAIYTFRAHRINDVPIAMFLATHPYFMLYHTLTNMALRRWHTSVLAAKLPAVLKASTTCALVVLMAWVTAFMEAFTIQGFPYYAIKDRSYMYTVGGIVYGIYFVVSFPMHLRMDGEKEALDRELQAVREGKAGDKKAAAATPAAGKRWSLSQCAIDSLAASMLITILLDLWRIGYTTLKSGAAVGRLPWMLPAYQE